MPDRPRPRGVAQRALASSLAVTFGILGLNLVTGVLLARTLGPSGRGELTAVLLWPAILAVVGSLGMSDALTYYAARGEHSVGQLVGSAVALALLQSCLLIAIGFLLEPVVLQRYGRHAVHSAEILLVGFIPATLVATYLLGVLNGRQRLIQYQLLRGLVVVLTAAILVAESLRHSLSVRHAVYAYIAANLGMVLVLVLVLGHLERSRPKADRRLAVKLAAFGVKSHTSNVSVLLNDNLGQLLVSVALSPPLLGLFTVASTMGNVVSMIGYSVAPVALPLVAAPQSDDRRRARATALVAATLVLSLAFALPVIVFAPQLVDAVFGHPFHGAATSARLLVAGGVLFSVNRALEAILKAVGRPLDAGIAEFVALGITAASIAILLPLFGLVGVAAASILAAGASGLLLVRRARQALSLSITDLFALHPGDMRVLLGLLRTRRAPVSVEAPAPESPES